MWKGRGLAKKKVFVSFDFDNDRSLKDLIIGQSKNPDSPFEISDYSLKEAKPEKDWLDHAERAIKRSDVVIFMLGAKTRTASGVLKERNLANENGKKRFQLIGYTNGKKEWAIPNGGPTYLWTWANLKKLLA